MATHDPRTTVNDIIKDRRYAWNEAEERKWHPDIQEPEFWAMVHDVWDYTVLGTAALYNIYTSVDYVVKAHIPGDFVECGVFMGGSVMFTAELCKRRNLADRSIYALDTFRGFVRRSALDVDFNGQEYPAADGRGQHSLRRVAARLSEHSRGRREGYMSDPSDESDRNSQVGHRYL